MRSHVTSACNGYDRGKVDTKLTMWKPEVSREVRAAVSDVIDAAGNDALDLLRSRTTEQEVLD
jgi:hypothetical protein